jgi:UDP-glucose 4-epimerase
MSILLAGGLGFIGSNIAIELLKQNKSVLIVDNLSNSDLSCLDNLYDLCDFYNIDKSLLNFIEADLTVFPKIHQIFVHNKIEHIINLAGKKAVAESIKYPNEYYYTNINIHLNFVVLIDLFKIKTYIFSSSATVYGTSSSPLNENSVIGNGITNPYGWTKYMIEIMIKDFANSLKQNGTNSNTKLIVLRYFNPVGSDITNTLGENPKNIPNNLMPVLLSKLNSITKLSIFGGDYNTKDGSCIRDFIHVYDLAIGHIKALEYANTLDSNTNYEVFNLGSGSGYSVLELVNNFNKINKTNIEYNIVDKRPGDLDICWADSAKAKNILKWEPVKTLDDMCADSYKYYLKKNQILK